MGINYFRNGEVIKITILDSTKRKIEEHICNANDNVKAGKILRYLEDKYGFKPTIDLYSSPNFKEADENKQSDKEIDWWG